MQDLDRLVKEEAHRLRPMRVPDFASLEARRRRRAARSRLVAGAAAAVAALGVVGLAQSVGGSDRLGTGDQASGGSGERAYFAVRYLEPREYEPRSAARELQQCISRVPGSRIDNSTAGLIPLHTLSAPRDEEPQNALAACLQRIGNVRISPPEFSSVAVVAVRRHYSVNYLDIETYDRAASSAALASCVSLHEAAPESVEFRVPPIPTVSMSGLPGRHASFLDCLNGLGNVRVDVQDS